MKKGKLKEYVRSLRMILNTELRARNEMQAVRTLEISVLRHSFGIINWNEEKIQKLDRETRKIPTIHGQHHRRTDADHLYVPKKGGRGLMQTEGAYITEVMKMMDYVGSKDDTLRQSVTTHQYYIDWTMLQTVNKFKE
jgi:hypothetical protein